MCALFYFSYGGETFFLPDKNCMEEEGMYVHTFDDRKIRNFMVGVTFEEPAAQQKRLNQADESRASLTPLFAQTRWQCRLLFQSKDMMRP